MSYPNVIFGTFGDEKVTSTSKIGGLPLGTEMLLPDGRKFRHAMAGATAIVPGKLYEGPAIQAQAAISDATLAVNSAAVGATSINITKGAGTAMSANTFAGGYIWTASSVGTGIGYLYKVKSHLASAGTAAATIAVLLEENETVKVALAGGTTTAGLGKSPYDGVVLTTADTVNINTPAGVSCSSAAASAFVWLQNKGPAAVMSDATLLIGAAVVASSAAAGAVAPFIAPMASTGAAGTTTDGWFILGHCMAVAAASLKYALIDLNIR